VSGGWGDLSRDGRREHADHRYRGADHQRRDDGTYATLNNAALVISGDRVAWAGPASRAPAADRADRTDLTNTPIGDGVTRWVVRANARSG
jgi:hypothetical protein